MWQDDIPRVVKFFVDCFQQRKQLLYLSSCSLMREGFARGEFGATPVPRLIFMIVVKVFDSDRCQLSCHPRS